MRGWTFLIDSVIALLIDIVICDVPERFKLDLRSVHYDKYPTVPDFAAPDPCTKEKLEGLVFVKTDEKEDTWKSFTKYSGSTWQSTDYEFDTKSNQLKFPALRTDSDDSECLEYDSDVKMFFDHIYNKVPIVPVGEDYMKTDESSQMNDKITIPVGVVKTEEGSPGNDPVGIVNDKITIPVRVVNDKITIPVGAGSRDDTSTGQKVTVTYNRYSRFFGTTFHKVPLDPAIQDCASTRIAIEVAVEQPRAKVISLTGPNGENIHVDNCDSSAKLTNSAWTVSDEIELLWQAAEISVTSDDERLTGGGHFAWWTVVLIILGPVACFVIFYVLVYFCRTRLHTSSKSYKFTLSELGPWP